MLNILIVNGSPRKGGNSSILSEKVREGAEKCQDVQIHLYEFAGKKISGCQAVCQEYCKQNCQCIMEDDLRSLWDEFVWADGIVWCVPVYHVGPPGQVKCALDRLCNLQWGYFDGQYPRWNKAIGACVQGASRWGGQELGLQWFLESSLLLKCIPVAADPPKSYFGVAGCAGSWDRAGIQEDELALALAENIGQRVAETAGIIQAGLRSRNGLDVNYYPGKYMELREKEKQNSKE